MKVIIIFICLVFSIKSFSQKLTYKDFVGGRYIFYHSATDTANTDWFSIDDSSHITIVGENWHSVLTYNFDTVAQKLILTKSTRINRKTGKLEDFNFSGNIHFENRNAVFKEYSFGDTTRYINRYTRIN